MGLAGLAMADDIPTIRSISGSAGLIDMPIARMAPDGQPSIGTSFCENTQPYNFGF
jgi:hypothetical protein